MRSVKVAFFVLLVNWCQVAIAENDLQLGDGVKVLAINGQEVESTSYFDASSKYQLNNGTNQLLVEYQAELKRGGDIELETSDSFVLLFTASDKKLRLDVPMISSIYEFQAFNRQGDWKLKDSAGISYPYKLDRLVKEGFQLGRDYARELDAYNRTDAIAAFAIKNPEVFPAPSRPAVSPGRHAGKSFQASDQKLVKQMLIYWYNQADSETRKQFRSWLLK